MHLKDYLRSGPHAMAAITADLGVTEHAVRKWAYGQRNVPLNAALRIEEITAGAVTVRDMATVSDGGRAGTL